MKIYFVTQYSKDKISINVAPSMTIGKFKDVVKDEKTYKTTLDNMYFNTEYLDMSKSFNAYEIKHDDTINEYTKVFVKRQNQQDPEIEVLVTRTDTVADLKKHIHEKKKDILVSEMHLTY